MKNVIISALTIASTVAATLVITPFFNQELRSIEATQELSGDDAAKLFLNYSDGTRKILSKVETDDASRLILMSYRGDELIVKLCASKEPATENCLRKIKETTDIFSEAANAVLESAI